MKISAEKLQEIIESHGRWLRNEEGGERANLRSADLSSADLSSADLDKTYYQVVRVGSRRGITTYCVDNDNVLCGRSGDKLKRPRILTIYKHKGKYTPAEVISP